MKIKKIEIQFPVDVEIPKDWDRRLHDMVREVCEQYKKENPERTMWPCEIGFKPTYIPITRADELKRGMEFDESCFCIGVHEREKY